MKSAYRNALPQLEGKKFLTDGGLETVLIFQRNMDLPEFAAFDLLTTFGGRQEISRYFHPYIAIARYHEMGFILESPTWRANPDWAAPRLRRARARCRQRRATGRSRPSSAR